MVKITMKIPSFLFGENLQVYQSSPWFYSAMNYVNVSQFK